MSDTFSRVEIITGVARRRRFTTEQKLAVVAETMQAGMSISYVPSAVIPAGSACRNLERLRPSPRTLPEPGVPMEAADDRRRPRSRPSR
jgi:hypothetical protein